MVPHLLDAGNVLGGDADGAALALIRDGVVEIDDAICTSGLTNDPQG